MAGCKKDKGFGKNGSEVKFTGNVEQIQTRVSGADGTLWDANDPVGIYMIKADPGTLAAANALSSNRPYAASAGASATFTAVGNSPIYYPDDGSAVKFVAYHPWTIAVTADYKVPINVSDQSNLSAIDALYASVTASSYSKSTSAPVALQFEHALTKLIFNIANGTGITEPVANGITVEIAGQQVAGTLDLTDGTVAATGAPTTISAEGTGVVEMIVLPATTADISIVFANNAGQRFDITIPGSTVWQGGYRYTYNVTLELGGINGGTATTHTGEITPWNDGGSAIPVTGIGAPPTMTMVTEAGRANIHLAGSGRAIIDWGDGTKTDISALASTSSLYAHTYTDGLSSYTITITGNNITSLLCFNHADINDNLLTKLDVSKNIALTRLMCSNNLLTELDVSNNIALISLDCGGNPLTELDVSNNIALTSLTCGGNQLTKLDVSNNIALTSLTCRNNLLTELDISNNIALTSLDCSNNPLIELNVSSHIYTTLRSLTCNDNQLTELDVSNYIALRSLNCFNNQLTELDISNNIALESLYCDNNPLTELDVSNNIALTFLSCARNQLTELDVSNNTALTRLYCENNPLTELDVSGLDALSTLWCYRNYMNATALNALFGTLNSTAGTKNIRIGNNGPSYDGTGTAGCDQSIATAKGWTVNISIM